MRITQDDLRRFLGYSTVEQAGIVLLGFGVALLGQTDTQQPTSPPPACSPRRSRCAPHNLAKTLALIGIDRVEQATGQRTIDPLGGLARRHAAVHRRRRRRRVHARRDPAARRVRQRVVHLRSAAAGLPDADAALAAAVRAGRRRTRLHRRPGPAGLRQVLRIHLPRHGPARRSRTGTETVGRSASIIGLGDDHAVPRCRRAVGDPRHRLRPAATARLRRRRCA